jgi:hypothetical protein
LKASGADVLSFDVVTRRYRNDFAVAEWLERYIRDARFALIVRARITQDRTAPPVSISLPRELQINGGKVSLLVDSRGDAAQ